MDDIETVSSPISSISRVCVSERLHPTGPQQYLAHPTRYDRAHTSTSLALDLYNIAHTPLARFSPHR